MTTILNTCAATAAWGVAIGAVALLIRGAEISMGIFW